jgi:hypothetical protein
MVSLQSILRVKMLPDGELNDSCDTVQVANMALYLIISIPLPALGARIIGAGSSFVFVVRFIFYNRVMRTRSYQTRLK